MNHFFLCTICSRRSHTVQAGLCRVPRDQDQSLDPVGADERDESESEENKPSSMSLTMNRNRRLAEDRRISSFQRDLGAVSTATVVAGIGAELSASSSVSNV